jgi:MucR family transcriptional regulator, transcriptional regulator of exopolysaccharide biosynthesis
MADRKTIDPGLVAKIVGSYVKHNEIPPGELPNLIAVVHRSLAELGKPAEVTMVPTPAVARNRSYGRNFVVCLECGWRGQTLRRHLTASHGQAPAEYRARWRLKATHPLTAPAYSERRSTLAKQLGLGQGRQASAVAPEPLARKRRGRPPRTTP